MILLPAITFFSLSGTLVAWFLLIFVRDLQIPPITPDRCVLAVILPSVLAYYGLKKKSLNASGARMGFLVGFVLSMSSYAFTTSLMVFFLTGSKITKWRSSVKKKFEENFKEGGQRNWLQVICNGGVAAELALLYCIDSGSRELPIDFSKHYTASWLATGIIGALACSCGDTFASEVGSAVGTLQPRLITTFKKVPRGTNGAISFAGTVASGLGGLMIGLTFYVTNLLVLGSESFLHSPPQWPVIILAIWAGFIGSLVDSLLGATFQFSGLNKDSGVVVEFPGQNVVPISGIPFFDNHNINLLSSLITSIITSLTAYKVFEWYS